MRRRSTRLWGFVSVAGLMMGLCAHAQNLDDILRGRTLEGKIVKGVAIGYAVRQASPQLNQFINAVTLRQKMPTRYATKVVPILSVGERAFVGGAQVIGPRDAVQRTQVVWQYEDQFQRGSYRIRALVPSSSLNPLAIRRVPKVGISALIDVSLSSSFRRPTTRSGAITGSRVLLAAGVAAGVMALADPLNKFINTVTFNRTEATRVVPQVSVGERAYIGGAQITGSTLTLNKVKAVFEYQDIFDRGRFRVRVLIPVNGVDPTRIRRVDGVGVLALIDTTIAPQQAIKPKPSSERIMPAVIEKIETGDERDDSHGDRGLHKGWEQGKHKGWDKKKKHENRSKHGHEDDD